MKITEVKAFALSFKLENAPRRGVGQPVKKDTVIVRVKTEDGIVGYGEAHHALAPTLVADLVNTNLAPIVVGCNAMEVEDIWQRIYLKQGQTHGPGNALYKALSGVDVALWDARGKALKQPVYRLLGGSRKKIRAYAGGVCMGFKPPPALLEEAQSFVDKGFTAIKLRMGDTVENDLARVRAVRKGLGDKIDIAVDINTRYNFLDLQRALPGYEECRVFWVEEPFAPDAIADYAHFNARTHVPLAGGENHFPALSGARTAGTQGSGRDSTRSGQGGWHYRNQKNRRSRGGVPACICATRGHERHRFGGVRASLMRGVQRVDLRSRWGGVQSVSR